MNLRKCEDCGEYTLHKECSCGGDAKNPHPPKFSREDRHWRARLQAKGELE